MKSISMMLSVFFFLAEFSVQAGSSGRIYTCITSRDCQNIKFDYVGTHLKYVKQRVIEECLESIPPPKPDWDPLVDDSLEDLESECRLNVACNDGSPYPPYVGCNRQWLSRWDGDSSDE